MNVELTRKIRRQNIAANKEMVVKLKVLGWDNLTHYFDSLASSCYGERPVNRCFSDVWGNWHGIGGDDLIGVLVAFEKNCIFYDRGYNWDWYDNCHTYAQYFPEGLTEDLLMEAIDILITKRKELYNVTGNDIQDVYAKIRKANEEVVAAKEAKRLVREQREAAPGLKKYRIESRTFVTMTVMSGSEQEAGEALKAALLDSDLEIELEYDTDSEDVEDWIFTDITYVDPEDEVNDE